MVDNEMGGVTMRMLKKGAALLLMGALLCSCGVGGQTAGDGISGQEEISENDETIVANKELLEILRDFNWISELDDSLSGKPFLEKNRDGSEAVAGIIDIDLDGNPEFFLALSHPPRSIPAVEIFSVVDGKLSSIGGFFRSRAEPNVLSCYRDTQGHILFLQQPESYYGGTRTSLVATYLDDFRSVPIVTLYTHYGQAGTELYYVYPHDGSIDCTGDFLYGIWEEGTDVLYQSTEEAYEAALAQFMESLTWITDIEYSDVVSYHLHNSPTLTGQLRREEIDRALEEHDVPGTEQFQTPEEYKKSSDMVAEALYKAALNFMDEPGDWE